MGFRTRQVSPAGVRNLAVLSSYRTFLFTRLAIIWVIEYLQLSDLADHHCFVLAPAQMLVPEGFLVKFKGPCIFGALTAVTSTGLNKTTTRKRWFNLFQVAKSRNPVRNQSSGTRGKLLRIGDHDSGAPHGIVAKRVGNWRSGKYHQPVFRR